MATEEFVIEMPVEGFSGVVTANGLVDRLIGRVKDQILGLDLIPSKEVFLAACSKAFDNYVEPFDIPLIPNFIEPYVDAQLKSVFMANMDRLYDAVLAKKAAGK
jgi:hypothetical protein